MEATSTLQDPAKWLAIIVGTLSALLFLPSLLPAGFAIYVLDAPGSGPLHDVYVGVTFAVLLFMPLICILGVIVPWRGYRRGAYQRVVAWTLCTMALMLYWAPSAYTFYFT